MITILTLLALKTIYKKVKLIACKMQWAEIQQFFSVNDTIKYSHKLTCAVKYSRWQLNCQTIFATIGPPILSFSYFYFSNCFLNWGNPRHLKSPRRQPYIHTSILFFFLLSLYFSLWLILLVGMVARLFRFPALALSQ